MPELEKRIGLLRLLVADVGSKRANLSEMEAQYRAQLARIVEFVIYREGDVSNALSLMSEVQGKLNEVVQTGMHLDMINSKAGTELEVLLLTKRVAEARSQLSELEGRQQELSQRLHFPGAERETPEFDHEAEQVKDLRALHEEVTAVASEISRLHDLITEASERAVRTIQEAPRGSAKQEGS